jgi:hypothetical protein
MAAIPQKKQQTTFSLVQVLPVLQVLLVLPVLPVLPLVPLVPVLPVLPVLPFPELVLQLALLSLELVPALAVLLMGHSLPT